MTRNLLLASIISAAVTTGAWAALYDGEALAMIESLSRVLAEPPFPGHEPQHRDLTGEEVEDVQPSPSGGDVVVVFRYRYDGLIPREK